MNPSEHKERTEKQKTIELFDYPKLISKVKKVYGSILVGFKMLVDGDDEAFVEAAEKSILDNRCDIVFVNNKRGHGQDYSLIAKPTFKLWAGRDRAAQSLVEEIEIAYVHGSKS